MLLSAAGAAGEQPLTCGGAAKELRPSPPGHAPPDPGPVLPVRSVIDCFGLEGLFLNVSPLRDLPTWLTATKSFTWMNVSCDPSQPTGE